MSRTLSEFIEGFAGFFEWMDSVETQKQCPFPEIKNGQYTDGFLSALITATALHGIGGKPPKGSDDAQMEQIMGWIDDCIEHGYTDLAGRLRDDLQETVKRKTEND